MKGKKRYFKENIDMKWRLVLNYWTKQHELRENDKTEQDI